MGMYAEEVERCIRCGFCDSVCPTSMIGHRYVQSKTSKGRLIMLQAALELGSPEPFSKRFKELIDLCFGCYRCIDVCPAGIEIPRVMSSYRAAYITTRGEGSVDGAARLLSHYYKYAKRLASSARLSRLFLKSWSVRWLIDKLLGIALDSPLPVPEGGSLDDYFKSQNPDPSSNRRYVLFADTYARYIRPSIGIRLHSLLRSAGIELIFPRQTDSGIVALEFGFLQLARKLALENIENLYPHVEAGRMVLCISPAATMMLRHEYPRLIGDERAEKVAEATLDLHELLLREVEVGRLAASPRVKSFTLHNSCLSQALGLSPLIRELLEKLGCSITSSRSECCGMAGSWGLIKRNRKISKEVGAELFSKLSGPIVSNSETCTLQIANQTKLEVYLPIEVIEAKGVRKI